MPRLFRCGCWASPAAGSLALAAVSPRADRVPVRVDRRADGAPATCDAAAVRRRWSLPTTAVPPIEPLDPPELRAVWVDAFHDGFKSPEQVDDLVAWAREANSNALFVQVRRRGDAYYLKSFEPRADDPDLAPGFDALQYLIDRAHQGPQRLQVHAWLATLPIWHRARYPPRGAQPPVQPARTVRWPEPIRG